MNKKRIYEIVEASGKNDKASKAYDIMIFVAVIVGLIPLTVKHENRYMIYIDLATALIFAVDYALRIVTSDYKMGVKSYKAYLYYVFTPMAIIDLLSVVPILSIFFPHVAIFGYFRLFRILRVFKLIRYSKTMVSITNVLKKVRKELAAVLVLALVYIAVCALVIFQLEPDLFDNFFEALYWATVSITTIGYGDIAPATPQGQLLTMISALMGVAIIALPSGIITAAYMEEIRRKKTKYEK